MAPLLIGTSKKPMTPAVAFRAGSNAASSAACLGFAISCSVYHRTRVVKLLTATFRWRHCLRPLCIMCTSYTLDVECSNHIDGQCA